ncbi:hypothetical protein [Planctomycetes bacterium K23_9]|uniref:hypothetical protein n=1 Tax=Stieleria marina TaxID=1930275 RepID=UPI0011A0E163
MSSSSLPSQSSTTSATPFVVGPGQAASKPFVDRREGRPVDASGERRQFGSSHVGLSTAGHELAVAIDQYKLQHHRRYITCDEMLTVIQSLGYARD